jgi:arginyl-tRNA synthetase
MQTVAAQLQAILQRALAQLPDPPPADFDASVLPAADARFGDYQANAAMTLAKQRRTNPRALAAQIVELLHADAELAAVSAPPEIAGAGFINFRLRPEFLAERLAALQADPERLGVSLPSSLRRIVIDFSGPNIAKPMHVGHLRSTIIGDCLARVARFLGHEVITDNHLGDWGTQFGKVIFGWKHFLNEEALAADPLAELVSVYQRATRFTDPAHLAQASADLRQNLEAQAHLQSDHPNKLLLGMSLEETPADHLATDFEALAAHNADACRAELAKLQSGDPENLAIWRRCVELSRAELDKIYARLDIRFDHQFGESYFNNQLAPLVERLEKIGIAQPSEGALVVFFPDDPKLAERPAIIRKRDGAFNYATTDIATYEQRVNEFCADALWYVVGAPQALHFEQINAIVRRMGYAAPLTHIPFGSILGEDRKIMRTRSGENVALRDLLDEAIERARATIETKNPMLADAEKADIARIIGLGAVKYAELSQHRLTDYIFSWDKMLSFQGNTAPYLQNAYVRIRSIFRRGNLDFEAAPSASSTLALTEPVERDLARKLAQFAEIIPAILEDFRPNLLANYLYELAGIFHGFFEACPVLKSEGVQRETRLALCQVTARILQRGLGLLGIETPERM